MIIGCIERGKYDIAVSIIHNSIARLPPNDECKARGWPNLRPVLSDPKWKAAEQKRKQFGIKCRKCKNQVFGGDVEKYWKVRNATLTERTHLRYDVNGKMVPVYFMRYWECPKCKTQHSHSHIDKYKVHTGGSLPRTHGMLPMPPKYHVCIPRHVYDARIYKWCALALQAINHAEGIYERLLDDLGQKVIR